MRSSLPRGEETVVLSARLHLSGMARAALLAERAETVAPRLGVGGLVDAMDFFPPWNGGRYTNS